MQDNMGMHKMGQVPDTKQNIDGMVTHKNHMGMMKGLLGMGMGMMKGLLGMGMGMMRIGKFKGKGKRQVLGGSWVLVKKANGQCECTQTPQGQIVIGRFYSNKECQDHRAHDC